MNFAELSDSSDSEYVSSDQTEEVVERMGNAALVASDEGMPRINSILHTPRIDEPQIEESEDIVPETFDLDLPPEHLVSFCHYIGEGFVIDQY